MRLKGMREEVTEGGRKIGSKEVKKVMRKEEREGGRIISTLPLMNQQCQ